LKTEDKTLERNIIAQSVNDEKSCATVMSLLRKQDFYHHASEFEALQDMYDNGKPIDTVCFIQELRGRDIDTPLTHILMGDNLYGSIDYHISELRKHTKARQLAKIANLIRNALTSENVNVDDLSEHVLQTIDEIENLELEGAEEIITPKQQAQRMMDTLEEVLDDAKRKKKCIYTSSAALNRATGGFEDGDMVIISGPTGGGKTAFASNIMRDIAIDQSKPVLYINTEMSQKQLDLRWASIITESYAINNTNLRNGKLNNADLQEVTRAISRMSESEFYLTTIPDLHITKMLAIIRKYVRKHNIKVVVIDYIGRIETSNANKRDEEWRQMLKAAKKIKTIAQQLKIVCFMVAQINKDGDLAQSRQMENECDLHLQIRELDDKEKNDADDYFDTGLDIRKARNSRKGLIPCRFAGEKLKFFFDHDEAQRHHEYTLGKSTQIPGRDNGSDDEKNGDSEYYRGRRRH